jgi:predicted peptidase
MPALMQPQHFEAQLIQQVKLSYLLYLPPEYDQHDVWPLLLFLHGGGERGNDLYRLYNHGIPRLIHEGQQFPFIIAAPQCNLPYRWSDQVDALARLVEALMADYKVDSARIYLTGMSQGGCGAWHLAMRYRHLFAALAIVCGYRPYTYGYAEKLLPLCDLPIWAFHGGKDEVVDVSETEKMVAALEQHGAPVRYTPLPDANHQQCWEQAYALPELYEWLLKQSR